MIDEENPKDALTGDFAGLRVSFACTTEKDRPDITLASILGLNQIIEGNGEDILSPATP